MSCVSIQTVFWLNVCRDQWSSWGISGVCFFIQGWPNLWINPLIDWKKPHWMLSIVRQKKSKSLVKYNHSGFLWPALAVMNRKINHFWAQKLHSEHMHTVKSKVRPNSLDFYFKVLLKYLAAAGSTKKPTHTTHNTVLGYMTGTDAMLGRAKGPSRACEGSWYTCVSPWRKRILRVSACHFISCTAKPEQMLLLFGWCVGDQGFMHGTQHGHLQLAPDVSCQTC